MPATRSRSRGSSRARPDVPGWARKLFALIPGYDPVATAAPGEYFHAATAQHALHFIEAELQLIEGEAANQPFHLEPWQAAIVACLFGWVRADGTRRYREAMIYVPRKNGKTPFCAALVNYVMFCDHEPGAQLYSAAAEREQAALIFRHASGMIARNPRLASKARIYRSFRSIEYGAEGTIYKALSADADTKHGLGAHLVIVDELHAHPNGDLVDVLQTSTAARRQPLVIYITTADFARESICNSKYDYSCKVRDGALADSSFLPVIYEALPGDDWTSRKVWAKANPNLGVSVKLNYLERECERAKQEPSYENTFKRLHLNIRTQQDVRWIPMERWAACADPVDEDAMAGRECFGALDLSSKIDITAWVMVFPPTADDPLWRVLPRFFIPAENAHQREKRDRVPYETWSRAGFITLTDGNVVDYDFVKAQVRADAAKFKLREIAYDPWNATQIALQLQDDGATMVEFRQGFASLSEPSKEFERLVVSKQLAHGGNPVLAWMASNVAIEEDASGNIKPSKKKSTERIDGIVTTVMGVGRALTQPSVSEPSIFFV
jgi:phage terminase large subunit-like protein